MQQQTKSIKIDLRKFDKGKVGNELVSLGMLIESPKTEYEIARYKGDLASLVIYSSGKAVIQSKDEELVGKITATIGHSEKAMGNDFVPHVGSDEVGKGDYFGPLVVCSAYLDEKGLELVKEYGVMDSKKMSDDVMLDIYDEISGDVIHAYTVTPPTEYNEIYARVKNASVLLGMQHGEAIENLLVELDSKGIAVNEIIIDQFSSRMDRINANLGPKGKMVKITQFPKGESDPAVAIASVFARAIFIKEWNKMEMEYGIKFPKGATVVLPAARRFVKNMGRDRLGEVAKLSFRTTDQI